MRRTFCLLFIFFMVRLGIGQNLVYIPDPNFRSFINDTYPGFMVGDSLIVDSAITVTGTFDCHGQGIADLTGIEYFENISELWCYDNLLTFLPDLSALGALTSLWCDDNQLTALPDLSANTTLNLLWCSGNQLTSLPELSNLTALTWLWCADNQLTSLPDLSSLSALQILNVNNNLLDSLPDLSALTSLTELRCALNELSQFPDLSGNPVLMRLVVNDNQLTSLPDLSNNLLLNWVDCRNNLLNRLPDFSANTTLSQLYCQNNKLDFSDARELLIADALPNLNTFVYFPQKPFGEKDTLIVNEDQTAELRIASQDSASGYQWYKNGALLPGAVDTLYMIDSVMLADSGSYVCKSLGTALANMQHPPGISQFVSEPSLLRVIHVNHPPVFITSSLDTALEDSPYSFTLQASDNDGDSLSFQMLSGPGWLNLSPNGQLSGTPSVADTGTTAIQILVTDTGVPPLTDLLITAIHVLPVNDPPEFSTTHLDSAIEDIPYSFPLLATDEENDSLVFTKISGAQWLSVSPDGIVSGTPTVSDTGSSPVHFLVTDLGIPPLTDTLITDMVVLPRNDPPVFLTTLLDTAYEDIPYSFNLTAQDEENDSLTFLKLTGPDWLQVSPLGIITGTPTVSDTGVTSLKIVVIDNGIPPLADTLSAHIVVQSVNDPPRFIITQLDTAFEDIGYSFELRANDEEGDSLTFSKITGPDWLTVSPDGELTGTPVVSDTGITGVKFKVSEVSQLPLSDTLKTWIVVLINPTPPNISTAVLQNPAATRHAEIVVVSDLTLKQPPLVSVWVDTDTVRIPMSLIKETQKVYHGPLQFTRSGVYGIRTRAVRLNGVDTIQTRNFTVILAQPGASAKLFALNQRAVLSIPEASVLQPTYFVSDYREENNQLIYDFGPHKKFRKNLTLEFRYNPAAYPDPSRLFVYRREGDSWQPLRSQVYADAHLVKSRVDMLGDFKIGFDSTFTGSNLVPSEYFLSQNYPNPFNPVTTIEYALPEDGDLTLVIFNILGQKVKTLYNGFRLAGQYQATWEGTNQQGEKAASGIYFYHIRTANFERTKKMILLR